MNDALVWKKRDSFGTRPLRKASSVSRRSVYRAARRESIGRSRTAMAEASTSVRCGRGRDPPRGGNRGSRRRRRQKVPSLQQSNLQFPPAFRTSSLRFRPHGAADLFFRQRDGCHLFSPSRTASQRTLGTAAEFLYSGLHKVKVCDRVTCALPKNSVSVRIPRQE